jgi:hypothetical protein
MYCVFSLEMHKKFFKSGAGSNYPGIYKKVFEPMKSNLFNWTEEYFLFHGGYSI